MTKTIYLEKKSETIIETFAKEKGVSVSKAINLLIQGKAPVMIKDKPTASESKPPKEVKQIKQPKKKETPKERPLSRSELFRNISNNRS